MKQRGFVSSRYNCSVVERRTLEGTIVLGLIEPFPELAEQFNLSRDAS
jgi:hypothetical protein